MTSAIARNDLKMVEKLVQLGANVNMVIPCYSYFNKSWHSYFTSPLLTAVEMARTEVVMAVLNFGAKINMVVKTAAKGELDAETLAEQRQDFSVINGLKRHKRTLLSLKEMCRFEIRHQLISLKNYKYIEELPVPNPVINYLKFLH